MRRLSRLERPRGHRCCNFCSLGVCIHTMPTDAALGFHLVRPEQRAPLARFGSQAGRAVVFACKWSLASSFGLFQLTSHAHFSRIPHPTLRLPPRASHLKPHAACLTPRASLRTSVDYLKLDGCYNSRFEYAAGYAAMGSALRASGRDIVYSCSW